MLSRRPPFSFLHNLAESHSSTSPRRARHYARDVRMRLSTERNNHRADRGPSIRALIALLDEAWYSTNPCTNAAERCRMAETQQAANSTVPAAQPSS